MTIKASIFVVVEHFYGMIISIIVNTLALNKIALLANASTLLADKAITSFKVKEDNLQQALSRNPILVTALNPVIGYRKAAQIAKQAYATGRPIIDVAEENTDLSRADRYFTLMVSTFCRLAAIICPNSRAWQ